MSQPITVYTEEECPKTLFVAMSFANSLYDDSKTPLEIRVETIANINLSKEEVLPTLGFEAISEPYYSAHLTAWKESCSEEFRLLSSMKSRVRLGMKMLIEHFLSSIGAEPFPSKLSQGRSFIYRLETMLFALENTEQTETVKGLRGVFDDICAKIFTETNIRDVQQTTLKYFDQDAFADMSDRGNLLIGLKPEGMTPLIEKLALSWLSVAACSSVYFCKPMRNFPNQVFTLYPHHRIFDGVFF